MYFVNRQPAKFLETKMKTQSVKTPAWFHVQSLQQIATDRILEGIRHSAAKYKAWSTARIKRRRDRTEFRQLLAMNDAHLRDIGLTRADIYWANALPIEQSASQELEKLAHPRKAGQMAAEKSLN